MDSFNDNRICCYEINVPDDEVSSIKSELLTLPSFGIKNIGKLEGLSELPSDGSSRCFLFSKDLIKQQGLGNILRFMDRFGGAILPVIRVCSLEPGKEFYPHIDANVHDLFKPVPKGHVMPASINIVATPNSTNTTYWYRQTEMTMLHPWAAYLGEKPKLEKIDEMVINDRIVLFRTGQWHSIANESITDHRVVSSLFINYTISWDSAVEIFRRADLLKPRY